MPSAADLARLRTLSRRVKTPEPLVHVHGDHCAARGIACTLPSGWPILSGRTFTVRELAEASAKATLVAAEIRDRMQWDKDTLMAKHFRPRSCVVCLDAVSDHAVMPCGHVCLCAGCAPGMTDCPVCRAPAGEVRRMFLQGQAQ
jgi:hypothetical protein